MLKLLVLSNVDILICMIFLCFVLFYFLEECCNTNTGDIKIKNNDNGNYYDHKEFESYKERKNFNNNYIIFTKAIKENQK